MSDPLPASPPIRGVYFDGRSSAAHPVRAWVRGDRLYLQGEGDPPIRLDAPLAAVRIPPPLGRLRRALHLPGGAHFETDDLAAVAALERGLRRNRGLGLVNRLEARWPLVLASLAALVVAGWAFTQYGLPVAARWAARVTPAGVLRVMDTQTVRAVDGLLEPSQLPAGTQNRLQREFRALTREIGGDYPYRLLLRQGGDAVGPNAFALPYGTVVMTDELVQLSKSDSELLGVLAHEVGHVTGRHGARSLYQGAGLLVFVSLLSGDLISATTVAGALPTLLLQNGYSRDMEREADEVGGRYLLRHGGSTAPLAHLLQRLTTEVGGDGPKLLSTHPGLQDRLKTLKGIQGAGR